jgi:hypothetical protein
MVQHNEPRDDSARGRGRLVPLRVLVIIAAVVIGGVAGVLALGGASDGPRATDAATSAPDPTTAPESPAPAPPGVLVIGDSNLAFADAEVQAALRGIGANPITHGMPGYGLKDLDGYWLPQLTGLLAANDPDIVVVVLGTNDTSASDAAAFPGRMDRLMSAIGSRRVIWVTHTEARPGQQGAGATVVNGAIRAAQARWINLVVLDLAPLEATNTSLFGPDAVHFSVPGRDVFAREVATVAQQASSVPLDLPVPVTVPVTIPPVPALP